MNFRTTGYRVVRYLAECTEVCSDWDHRDIAERDFQNGKGAIQDGTSPWTDIELFEKFGVWKKPVLLDRYPEDLS